MTKSLFYIFNPLIGSSLFRKTKNAYHTPPSEQELSPRKLLYNLAHGNPSRAQNIVDAYYKNKTIPSPDFLYQQYHNRAFSWLADLDAYSANYESELIQELAQKIIVKHINHDKPLSLVSLKNCHETMMRIVRVWSCGHLLSNNKNKYLHELVIESSLKDIYSLKVAIYNNYRSLPKFIILEIIMILTLTRLIVHERQRSDLFSDALLNTLSEKISQVINKSHDQLISQFSQHTYIGKNYDNKNNQPFFWFNMLSNSIDKFFHPNPEHSTNKDTYQYLYQTSNEPTIHAHLFLWLFTTIEIINLYATIPPSFNSTLHGLFNFISPFVVQNKYKKNNNLNHIQSLYQQTHDIGASTFLNLKSQYDSQLSLNELLPPNNQALIFYIEQHSARYRDKKKDKKNDKISQNLLQSAGFHKINTKYLCSISFNSTPNDKKELYKENYALSPFLFFIATGNQSTKYPLFYQPSHKSENNDYPPYLEYSGIGLSNAQGEAIPFHSLNVVAVKDISAKTNSIEMNEVIRQHRHLDIDTTEDEYVKCSAGEIYVKDYDLSISRKILVSDEGKKLLGIDCFSPPASPRKQNLFYHIAFLCPANWIVIDAPNNKNTVLIKQQITEKIDYVWTLSLLDELSEWETQSVKGLGCWIYFRRQAPIDQIKQINWLLSLETGKRTTRENQTETQKTLNLNI